MSKRRPFAIPSCVSLVLLLVPAMGKAAPRYKPTLTYLSGGAGANTLAVADVNGDGKPDILVGNVANDGSASVGVLLGNGDGTFQAAQSYSTGGHSVTSVAVADLNRDGKPDVVVSQMEGVAALLGNGDGSFQSPQSYPLSSIYGTSGVAVADVNRDGKPDLLVALVCFPGFPDCNHQGGAGVLLGKGDGTFGSLEAYGTGGNSPTSIAVADVNHDGNLDLVVDNGLSASGNQHGSVAILLGDGNGTFQPAQNYDVGGFNGGTLTVADLNRDGNLDVIAANACAEANCYASTVGVLLGNGDGTFQTRKISTAVGGWSPDAVAVADVNGDGIPDAVVDNSCDNLSACDHGSVGVLLGKGDGTFSRTERYSSGGGDSNSIALADVNGDGIPDVFVANACALNCSDGGTVGVLLSVSPTTTSLKSSHNRSVYGQAVVLTSTVKSPSTPPTGKVRFTWGTHTIGTATLNASGVATLTDSKLNVGTYPIIAVYAGDANNFASSSSVVSQVVQEATSAAAITSSKNPSIQGQAVTFTATITSPTVIPTGSVTFAAGSAVLGTVQLGSGKARITTSSLPVGTTIVTVTYAGNSNISQSSASVTQTVKQ